ncbi:hypothetical protein PanWU01x14_204910 [Parasponia andersonii]|uniref:Uncharacterized protein n=1 Tax=Parasponia andersonii TaxID=3476 RepID=A0A2P5BWI6_PARAD|nr:hypothetical protein PanWU01x14_204910 [Parasponia andersonii]
MSQKKQKLETYRGFSLFFSFFLQLTELFLAEIRMEIDVGVRSAGSKFKGAAEVSDAGGCRLQQIMVDPEGVAAIEDPHGNRPHQTREVSSKGRLIAVLCECLTT